MARPVRILHLEDNTADGELVQAMLAEDGFVCEIVRVETRAAFADALDRQQFDLVVSDFTLPSYDGQSALLLAKAQYPDVPVLFFSGTLGEESAIQSLRDGATDYILKQRPARFVPAVRRALREANEQTERKRAEHNLAVSELRYRRLFETAKDGILILDYETGHIVDVNPFLTTMLGFSREEVLGQTLWDIGFVRDVAAAKFNFIELKQAGYVRYEDLPLETKDHRTFSVEFISNVYSVDAQRVIQCNIRDITERKRLEGQLRQAQKMEAVGQLTGGIAHDFNNLLTVINGYSELTLRNLKADDPLRPNLAQIKEAGERAAGLTRQLLAFSRKQVLAPKVLDLNAVVTNLDKMLQRLIGEDIELVTVLKPGLGRVKADPGQIEQVIMNLIVNARDAMAQGGKLTIETANVELDENFARRHVVVKPGQYVMLAVNDTGCGMNAETQRHIFEPFFTTKGPGKGTGLGLATVYGIVQQSGGSIWVYSEVGKGTTFKVYLPRVEEEPDAVLPSTVRAAPLKGAETILLVEDDEPLRELTLSILRHGGYHVLAASSREEAIQLCSQHQGPIHLMLTDVVMPGMSVGEFAEQLASTRPAMKVLHMSGYTDDTVVRHGVLEQSVAFLQKPFTTHSLLRKVREVLDVDSNKDSRSI